MRGISGIDHSFETTSICFLDETPHEPSTALSIDPSGTRFMPSALESLEIRDLLAAVTVDVSQVVRQVNTQLLGVNTAWWDSSLNTSRDRADGRGGRPEPVSLAGRIERRRLSL